MAPKPTKTTVAGKAPAGKSVIDKEAAAGKKTVSGVEKKKKKRVAGNRKRGRWESYIVKLLKQVHPDTGISKKSVSILNSFVEDILDRICAQCAILLDMTKQQTVTSRVVQSAVKLILPGELAKHAIADAATAVNKSLGSAA